MRVIIHYNYEKMWFKNWTLFATHCFSKEFFCHRILLFTICCTQYQTAFMFHFQDKLDFQYNLLFQGLHPMKKSAEVFGASIESVSSRLESLEKTVQLLTQSSNFQYLSQTSDFQVGPHRVKWDQADGEEKATKNFSRLNFF